MAIVGLFVEILRNRFKEGNGPSDWTWTNNANTTNIFIEASFAEGNTKRDVKPAIFVDKDVTVYDKIVLGDRAGIVWKDMSDYQWTLSNVPVIIECVSNKRGESAILGDIVQWTLHSASDAIQAIYALHDMTPPRLGRTVPYEADKEAWSSSVSFTVVHPVRWRTTPIRTMLQEMRLNIQNSDAEEHFIDIVSYRSGIK